MTNSVNIKTKGNSGSITGINSCKNKNVSHEDNGWADRFFECKKCQSSAFFGTLRYLISADLVLIAAGTAFLPDYKTMNFAIILFFVSVSVVSGFYALTGEVQFYSTECRNAVEQIFQEGSNVKNTVFRTEILLKYRVAYWVAAFFSGFAFFSTALFLFF